MKKKIKEFTLEELSNHCSNSVSCRDCPLFKIFNIDHNSCFIVDIPESNSPIMEKEIEVEESET